MNKTLKELTDSEILTLVNISGSIAEAARQLNVPRKTLADYYHRIQGTNNKKTFFLSCAQIDTEVPKQLLENMTAYAKYKNAKILVSGTTYNRASHGKGIDKGMGAESKKDKAYYFDNQIKGMLCNDNVWLNSEVVFLGHMNILPTASKPLSGFEAYANNHATIFPHNKICVQATATLPGTPAKEMFTTGSLTVPNFVQKKAGIKAEFYHEMGFLIVEVVNDKVFHIRNVIFDDKDEYSFQDLTTQVRNGQITHGHRAATLSYGDEHVEKPNPDVSLGTYGFCAIQGGIKLSDEDFNLFDYVKPRHNFRNDISDFAPRNHHNRANNDFLAVQRLKDKDVVESALYDVAQTIYETSREWSTTVIVESNHDMAFLKWLEDPKAMELETNPKNMEFYHMCNARRYKALNEADLEFNIFEWVITNMLRNIAEKNPDYLNFLEDIVFLKKGESYITTRGIEHTLHGHEGANGSRGSNLQFEKLAIKVTKGHTHSKFRWGGVLCTGLTGNMNQGYNSGQMSNWTYTHVLEYANGKRTHIDMKEYDGKVHFARDIDKKMEAVV